MSRDETLPSRGSKLMRLYLLAAALIVTPIALSYGIDPANTLPRFLTITVEGTDQTQIFRAMMCLYFGAVLFWPLPPSNQTGSALRWPGPSSSRSLSLWAGSSV